MLVAVKKECLHRTRNRNSSTVRTKINDFSEVVRFHLLSSISKREKFWSAPPSYNWGKLGSDRQTTLVRNLFGLLYRLCYACIFHCISTSNPFQIHHFPPFIIDFITSRTFTYVRVAVVVVSRFQRFITLHR